jgi:hypothetical protein
MRASQHLKASRIIAALTLLSLPYTAVQAVEFTADWYFVDGLELNNQPLQRTTSLRVRDPHFFVSPGLGCFDITDNDLLGQPNTSINNQINANFNNDANMDGSLDASTLWLFPSTIAGSIQRYDSAAGACSAPVASTTCAYPSISAADTYLVISTGTNQCFEPITGTTGGYTPAVASVGTPCFITSNKAVSQFDFNGISLPLYGVKSAGAAAANAPGGRVMFRGFLRETDANAAIIPATVPLVGGRPISVLLAGGTGNCSTRNDKDMLDGVAGWWFYLEQNIAAVPTTP